MIFSPMSQISFTPGVTMRVPSTQALRALEAFAR
jgi:hypothetical protein